MTGLCSPWGFLDQAQHPLHRLHQDWPNQGLGGCIPTLGCTEACTLGLGPPRPGL